MYPGEHPADRVAFEMASTGEQVTYGELERESRRAAQLYRSRGLVPGDGIAILLPNCAEFLTVVWGAQRSGLYFTPISTLFQQQEIDYILTNSDAKLLITTPALAGRISSPVLESLDVVMAGPPLQRALAEMPAEPVANEIEGAEMIYSSGTTGQPKGVRFPLSGAPLGTVPKLQQTRIRMHGISAATRYLSTAPLYHSAPLRYCLMVTRLGGTAVIMEKFDASHALSLIERHRITHSQWVPTMFVRLLRLPEEERRRHDLSSLAYVIHAAAPCPVDVKRRMIDWLGPIVYEYYSGTEANGSTAIDSAEWLAHPGSVGRPIHGQVHILDDDGNELGPGETGTVYFSGGSDFAYYKDPSTTAAARSRQGWTTLGDIGYLDGEGYLYLRDRRSFMIISGGVNIYPAEVEACLLAHPDVMDAAVFGIPNDEFGEEVKAVVQPVADAVPGPALERTLIDWCRSRMAHLKCPRSIDFEAELPRHPTGKLYKAALRDRYRATAPAASDLSDSL